jgi:hypothetical protein
MFVYHPPTPNRKEKLRNVLIVRVVDSDLLNSDPDIRNRIRHFKWIRSRIRIRIRIQSGSRVLMTKKLREKNPLENF